MPDEITKKIATEKPKAAASSGYASAQMQLDDILHKAALVYRWQATRWRQQLAAHKPTELWGLLQVSHEEVDALMASKPSTHIEDPLGVRQQLGPIEAELAAVSKQMAQRAKKTKASVILPIGSIKKRFGLNGLDCDLMGLLLLPELDVRYRRLIGYLLDDATQSQLTFELICDLAVALGESADQVRARLASDAPLRRFGLVSVDANPSGALTLMAGQPLRLESRITAFFGASDAIVSDIAGAKYLPSLDTDLKDLVIDEKLKRSLQAQVKVQRGEKEDAPPVLLLHGGYGSQRRRIAQAVSKAAGQQILLLDCKELSGPVDAQTVFQRVYREALLVGADIAVQHAEILFDTDSPNEHLRNSLLDWAEKTPVITWLLSTVPWSPMDRFHTRQFVRFDIPAAPLSLRQKWWQGELVALKVAENESAKTPILADMLANAFQLDYGQIKDAMVLAKGMAHARNPLSPQVNSNDIFEGCRRQTGEKLGALAKRIEPSGDLTFADLMLPPACQRQVDELRRRIRLHSDVYSGLGFDRRLMLGRGTIALFTGGPGTGKTLTARLLAKEQGVDLYQIDLSSVVSKYVGDTEKNLSRIFREAEDANAILFFDEADSLFGKRGEVKDARDRWANMEINYLLQRVEQYDGTVILATNLRQNIDAAFLRRIHTIVDFPFPDPAARARIWRTLFPPQIKAPDEDFLSEVAERFPLAGGNIRNIVVDAAFRAIDSKPDSNDCTILPEHLLVAIGREYLKTGKPITATEFGDEFYKVLEKDMAMELR